MKKIFILLLTFIFAISLITFPVFATENTAPELEKGILLYTFKNNTFSYKFQVQYTDADGDMPRYVFVIINGSRREMIKADINDNNSKDGILYILPMDDSEISKFAPKVSEWDINYWFRTNDGRGPVSTKISKLFALDTEAMGLTASNSAGGCGERVSSGCGCGH